MIYIYNKKTLNIIKHYAISNEIVDTKINCILNTNATLFDIDLTTGEVKYQKITNEIIKDLNQ